MAETAYLTATKLLGVKPALCSEGGSCATVLEGPWSNIAGVPLSVFGLGLYTLIAAAALVPVAMDGKARDDDLEAVHAVSERVLQMGATSAAVFSVFLITLLITTVKASCIFCATSATISILLFMVVWNGGIMQDRTAAAVYSAISTGATTAFAAAAFFVMSNAASMGPAAASGGPGSAGPYLPPEIEATSSPDAKVLAQRLRAKGARMFGAYWCSHCYDQKQAFGKEAFGNLEYIECARDGAFEKAQFCRERGVPGYPTWEIEGKLYPGEKDVSELTRLLDDAGFRRAKEYVPGEKK